MVKAILFDLGDTLLDFRPLNIEAIADRGARDSYRRLQQEKCKLPTLDKYRRGNVRAVKMSILWSMIRRREFNVLTMMRRRTARLGVPDTDELMLELAWMWYRPILAYSSVRPDVIPTLQAFRAAGIKLGVVSNTFIGGPLLDRHLETVGLLEFFPIRFYSSETGYRKPHPRIFTMALDALHVAPEDTLFVGDVVKNDIVGAGRMGMKTVLKLGEQHRSHPAADYVIHRISELLPIALPPGSAEAEAALAIAARD